MSRQKEDLQKHLVFEAPDGNWPSISELTKKAKVAWPGILVVEIIVTPVASTAYMGDDTTLKLEIEPSKEYWKRISVH